MNSNSNLNGLVKITHKHAPVQKLVFCVCLTRGCWKCDILPATALIVLIQYFYCVVPFYTSPVCEHHYGSSVCLTSANRSEVKTHEKLQSTGLLINQWTLYSFQTLICSCQEHTAATSVFKSWGMSVNFTFTIHQFKCWEPHIWLFQICSKIKTKYFSTLKSY